MGAKKLAGCIIALIGAGLFYAAFTVTATEWLGSWVSSNASSVSDQYTPKEILIAWGGMLAGIGVMMFSRKR